jgi:hypothetical protein
MGESGQRHASAALPLANWQENSIVSNDRYVLNMNNSNRLITRTRKISSVTSYGRELWCRQLTEER